MSFELRRQIAIPKRMRKLQIDHRGYPVPVLVQLGKDGKPLFAVNNEMKRQVIIQDDLCGICGDKLDRIRWFIGGPKSAFHPDGCYFDPPMHRSCATYALRVCPYLAIKGYKKVTNPEDIVGLVGEDHGVVVNQTDFPGQPEIFIAVITTGTILLWGEGLVRFVRPVRPYLYAEAWQNGRCMGRLPASSMIKEEEAHGAT